MRRYVGIGQCGCLRIPAINTLDSSQISLHHIVLQWPRWSFTDVEMWCDQLRRWDGSPRGSSAPQQQNETSLRPALPEAVCCVYDWVHTNLSSRDDEYEKNGMFMKSPGSARKKMKAGWVICTVCSVLSLNSLICRDYRGGSPKPQTAALSHAGWGSLLPSYPPGGHHCETHATWWPLWKLLDKVWRYTLIWHFHTLPHCIMHCVLCPAVYDKRCSSRRVARHTCGAQRMSFRDETTAGVDHKFASICVVPSVNQLSCFTCRGCQTLKITKQYRVKFTYV